MPRCRPDHRHPGWAAPHEFSAACCNCCAVTPASVFRYGLTTTRAEFLTPEEEEYVKIADDSDLEILCAITQAANVRKAMHDAAFRASR